MLWKIILYYGKRKDNPLTPGVHRKVMHIRRNQFKVCVLFLNLKEGCDLFLNLKEGACEIGENSFYFTFDVIKCLSIKQEVHFTEKLEK